MIELNIRQLKTSLRQYFFEIFVKLAVRGWDLLGGNSQFSAICIKYNILGLSLIGCEPFDYKMIIA